MCKHLLGECLYERKQERSWKGLGEPWDHDASLTEWRRAGGKFCWIAMQYEEGGTMPEESHNSQEQTCLYTMPSSVTDWQQPMGGMILGQMTMNFNVEQLRSLTDYLPPYICRHWQSAMHDHHRCSYFCFIELMILPEKATSLFFSYHVHFHHDRRGYRSYLEGKPA